MAIAACTSPTGWSARGSRRAGCAAGRIRDGRARPGSASGRLTQSAIEASFVARTPAARSPSGRRGRRHHRPRRGGVEVHEYSPALVKQTVSGTARRQARWLKWCALQLGPSAQIPTPSRCRRRARHRHFLNKKKKTTIGRTRVSRPAPSRGSRCTRAGSLSTSRRASSGRQL